MENILGFMQSEIRELVEDAMKYSAMNETYHSNLFAGTKTDKELSTYKEEMDKVYFRLEHARRRWGV